MDGIESNLIWILCCYQIDEKMIYQLPGEVIFEGILLGPVYTARAMGGLIDLIQKGYFTRDQAVLFWHTGGAPELFAWANQLHSI